jgi:hypothetical protein
MAALIYVALSRLNPRRRLDRGFTRSVIACDKREAFAQGSACDEAIQLCGGKEEWIASLRSQ